MEAKPASNTTRIGMDNLLERYHHVKSWRRRTGKSSFSKSKGNTPATGAREEQKQIQTDQAQSTFLGKLPLEIRILIYKQILLEFGHKQHISLDHDGLLSHTRCVGLNTTYISRDLQRYWGPWGHNHNMCLHASKRPKWALSILPLLLTCRQV